MLLALDGYFLKLNPGAVIGASRRWRWTCGIPRSTRWAPTSPTRTTRSSSTASTSWARRAAKLHPHSSGPSVDVVQAAQDGGQKSIQLARHVARLLGTAQSERDTTRHNPHPLLTQNITRIGRTFAPLQPDLAAPDDAGLHGWVTTNRCRSAEGPLSPSLPRPARPRVPFWTRPCSRWRVASA